MFIVEGTSISLSRGDTGALYIKANATRKDTGTTYVFGERDRALFTIKDAAGSIMKTHAYQVDSTGKFLVVFTNADTQGFTPGNYNWDVRYIINPYYDQPAPSGTWTDYDELTFPVAANTKCMHGGTYYIAGQAIQSSEEWTRDHWILADSRLPVDGDQVITPNLPMSVTLFTVVGEV